MINLFKKIFRFITNTIGYRIFILPIDKKYIISRLSNSKKRTLISILSECGYHIIPKHFYSSIADISELERTKNIWAKRSDLPGLNIDIEQQVANLYEICNPYKNEYIGNINYNYAIENMFGIGYGFIEAQAIHSVVRYYKPNNIIEVGGGVSTYCMLKAIHLNDNCKINFKCIEPFPSENLKQLDGIKLIPDKMQLVSLDTFLELEKNDILFIDSTHTVKPGSDVNYLILEVLPRLKKGVIVHFHDIYLPYDYQRNLLETYFQWMETSLLRAFLINNIQVEIIFCLSLLHYDKPNILKEVFPDYIQQSGKEGLQDDKYDPNSHFPSSIFIRIR